MVLPTQNRYIALCSKFIPGISVVSFKKEVSLLNVKLLALQYCSHIFQNGEK